MSDNDFIQHENAWGFLVKCGSEWEVCSVTAIEDQTSLALTIGGFFKSRKDARAYKARFYDLKDAKIVKVDFTWRK